MLHVLREEGRHEIAGLVTTINRHFDRVAMHGVRHDLLRAQANALDVPLTSIPLPWPCSNGEYERIMRDELQRAASEGITGMAFGDLFLEDVRAYREKLFAGSGITPIFPIWGMETAKLARAMVDAGTQAHLVCIDPKQCDKRFIGRKFDHALLDDLPAGVDPCGERGEFHTFVSGGPMFVGRLNVALGKVVERDGFVFADVIDVAG